MPNYYTSTQLITDNLQVVDIGEGIAESVNDDLQLEATAVLQVPWANRTALVDDIFINAVPYPRHPLAGALPANCSITPIGATDKLGSLADPEYARITINYNQDREASDNGESIDIVSESLEPTAEFLTLDHRKFRWTSGSGEKLSPEEAPGKLIVGFDYVQTRYQLTSLPVAILTPNVVNNASVVAALLGVTFPAETLLYVSSQPSRTINTSGTAKWTMASRFSYRQAGWNKFWRAETESFESMYLEGGSAYKNFPLADLSSLIV